MLFIIKFNLNPLYITMYELSVLVRLSDSFMYQSVKTPYPLIDRFNNTHFSSSYIYRKVYKKIWIVEVDYACSIACSYMIQNGLISETVRV